MSEESKLVAPTVGDEETPQESTATPSSENAVSKSNKKKSKKSKGKEKSAEAVPKPEEMEEAKARFASTLFSQNAALQSDLAGMSESQIAETLKKLQLGDLLTGLSNTPANKKDMGSYKFWQTQPVKRFDEEGEPIADGPIREDDITKVKTSPPEMIAGFEWVTMDLDDGQQMQEVYELLSGHYVEDAEAMFRFNYSASFLNWALKSPGWKKDWHVGVRVTASKKLVAFISAIPTEMRVRDNTIKCAEVNFLCIHKKLRSKRLTPVLIKEITRRVNLAETWQAIYTGGIVLPTPVATCRYYHRSLDWLKLYEAKFSPLPRNTTKQRQISKFALPTKTTTKGLREMEAKDVPVIKDLLTRYLNRFDMAPAFTEEEVEHWFLHVEKPGLLGERVVWCYVVEDDAGKVTDMFSFYSLQSSVIDNEKHENINAAYLFYYASETAFGTGSKEEIKKALKVRLNSLMGDALIVAKQYGFDVFNALTLLDNTLFLNEQKFGPGDGQLHYYLFNWRTDTINGGIDKKGDLDEKTGSGVGVVML